MFLSVSKIIPRALTNFGIAKQAKASFICETYRKIAPGIIAPKVLDNARAKYFKNGILTIAVSHPLWAQEIFSKRHILIKNMNEMILKKWSSLKKGPIKDIRTKAGAAEFIPEENA